MSEGPNDVGSKRQIRHHSPVMQRVIAVLEGAMGRALTDAEVAQRLYVSQASLGRWKTSNRPLDEIYLAYVAAQYGVHREWLETGQGPQWADQRSVGTLPEAWRRMLADGRELTPAQLAALEACVQVLASPHDWWTRWLIQNIEIARGFVDTLATTASPPA